MRSLLLQVIAVTTINIKSIAQRLWLSLTTVLAIALVVMVLLAFLAMANGFQRTIAGSGSDEIGVGMARACLIVPSPEPADLVAASRVADTGAALYKGDQLLVSRQSCKALAEYRLGRFASAAEWASKALSQPDNCSGSARGIRRTDHCRRVQASMLLSMSKCQLRQVDEAQAALAQGLEMAEAKLPKIESGDLGYSWDEWVFAQVLMHEARTLIEGSWKTSDESKTNGPPALHKEAR